MFFVSSDIKRTLVKLALQQWNLLLKVSIDLWINKTCEAKGALFYSPVDFTDASDFDASLMHR